MSVRTDSWQECEILSRLLKKCGVPVLLPFFPIRDLPQSLPWMRAHVAAVVETRRFRARRNQIKVDGPIATRSYSLRRED